MNKTINILSENVINQIAAGEVIQRPASVIKELLENAIDADAQNIHVIIKDAGKKLIQIIDDGHGMNEEDAKLCFHKHATSKIKNTEDILKINTMGFRGEALASIASVSEVELKTKTIKQSTGTIIHINNSEIKKASLIATKKGTSISVKNLFFNIPARKNFLKSNQIEMKHILEHFMQIAIANPKISFKFNNNNKDLYNLPITNLKQRIIQLFGKKYNEKILSIKEDTSIVSINGFLGNPLDAKKTRGDQFLYINNRFIKSGYLNHSIKTAMDNLIQPDQHPSYFIFLNMPSEEIDINVHPNKTEVKFTDEKAIYQILKAACKKSIGMHNIQPSLDFSMEKSFEVPIHIQKSIPREPKLNINTNFNPFSTNNKRAQENTQNIDKLFTNDHEELIKDVINIDHQYAIFIMNSDNSINVVNKKRAIERIIYESNQKILKNQKTNSQLTMNPEIINISPTDIHLIKDNQNLINSMGYIIDKITNNTIRIISSPSGIKNINTQEAIEIFLEELKEKNTDLKEKVINKIAKKIANNKSRQQENFLSYDKSALINMITQLLNCKNPFVGINGKACVMHLDTNQIFE